MAVQKAAGDVLRHLVDGRGRVDIPCAERLDERPDRERVREVVCVRVTDVDGNRFRAVCCDEGCESPLDLGKCVLPRHLDVVAVAAHERATQSVGIVVQCTERRSLRADEALRERVVRVPADPRHVPVLDLDPQAAGGLTERAGAKRDARCHWKTIQVRGNRRRVCTVGDQPTRRLSSSRTAGHSSSTMLYQAESRFSLVAHQHVLPMDSLELGGQSSEGGACPLVERVGLELDAPAAENLECMSKLQELGLGVRAGAPGRRCEPGPPDLEATVLRSQSEVARRADRSAGLQEDGGECHFEPCFGSLERRLHPCLPLLARQRLHDR